MYLGDTLKYDNAITSWNNSNEEIEVYNNIIQYLDIDKNKLYYAIVLYGETGCGKTYYCEHFLKDKMKQDNNYTLCRVSLYGTSTSDEIYDRIVTSILNIPNVIKSSYRDLIKTIINVLLRCINTNITMNIKPESLFTLISVKLNNILIVIDDIERSKVSLSDIFGIINNIVENCHLHTMIVSNARFTPSDTLSKNIIDKVIGYQYCYHISSTLIGRLAIEEMGDIDCVRFKIDRLTSIGIYKSGVYNIRYVYKIVPFLKKVLTSKCFNDTSIDCTALVNTYIDLIDICLKRLSGRYYNLNDNDKRKSESLSNNNESLKIKLMSSIVNLLVDGNMASEDNINEILYNYIRYIYPQSLECHDIQYIKYQLQNILLLDDNEVEKLASSFFTCIKEEDLTYRDIQTVMVIYDILDTYHFCDESDKTTVTTQLKNIVQKDPESSLHELSQYSIISINDSDGRQYLVSLLDSLIQYAKESIAQSFKCTIKRVENIDLSLQSMHLMHILDKSIDIYYTTITLIPVDLIERCFSSGNAYAQTELITFFQSNVVDTMYKYIDKDQQTNVYKWLEELYHVLSTSLGSQTTKLRRSRLIIFCHCLTHKLKTLNEL